MIEKIIVGRLDPEAFKTLEAKVESEQENLQQFFLESRFEEMGEIIGERAIFVSPEGATMAGRKGIARYFASLKEEGVGEVEFEPVNAYVADIDSQEHNYVAYIIWRFAYSRLEGLDPAGSWTGVTWHRFNCTWENP